MIKIGHLPNLKDLLNTVSMVGDKMAQCSHSVFALHLSSVRVNGGCRQTSIVEVVIDDVNHLL